MMVSEGSSITTLLADGATTLQLAPGSLASAAGAWLVSKLLLIPEGANLPIGFGVLVDNMLLHETFLANLAAQHCNASHCMPCHFMVTGYLVWWLVSGSPPASHFICPYHSFMKSDMGHHWTLFQWNWPSHWQPMGLSYPYVAGNSTSPPWLLPPPHLPPIVGSLGCLDAFWQSTNLSSWIPMSYQLWWSPNIFIQMLCLHDGPTSLPSTYAV